ncbi:hypothetical protein [Rubrivirga sp. IMCC43871]|uniref:hypothetical protein n=1 Tax=Rubrivirga sp. IMCC43871 TaxID=3391575 RepID=UPI00398F9F79
MRLPLALVVVMVGACVPLEGVAQPDCSSALAAFEGAFGAGGPASDDVVTFVERRGTLLMDPVLWSGPMVLRPVEADSFVVAAHPRFGAAFVRDADGCVTGARVHGLTDDIDYGRLGDAPPRAVQLLVGGHPMEAARAYAADPARPEAAVGAARQWLRSAPTRAAETAAFLAELVRLVPEAASAHAALGDALVAAGDRAGAQRAYEQALALDPAHEGALVALVRLGGREPSTDEGWTLPFALADLFQAPRPDEVAAVRAEWARRDLSARGVEVVLRRQIDLGGVPAEARVVAHDVHGQRHLGVVIVPDGATGPLPVLVEAKGVSPSFPPLEVPGGLTSPGFMGAERGQVIYVAPGYRGERVVIGADTVASEGDRSDAWDGATDDAIAFLHAALAATPEADASRVCVYGRSRGGAVALLTGIREPQVDCVVSWAAPTDWFSRMDLSGWTQAELVADGLRNRAAPGETGGQFIDYFLSRARDQGRTLAATRRHLIASSALYHADLLPLAQVHWGIEDSIVPIVNGRDFVARYEGERDPGACLDVQFHPRAGHDQDRQIAPIESRAFILRAFGLAPEAVAACRPE